MAILIFDYDGVILDSYDVMLKIFQQTASHYNLEPSEDNFKEMFNNNYYDSLKKRGISERDIKNNILDYKKGVENFSLKIFPGMKNVLSKLEKKNKVIIITSNLQDFVKKSLAENQITEITQVYGAESHLSKVNKIINIKQKHPKGEIFYIGDTAGDIKEGKLAGVTTIAVTWGYHDKNTLEKEKPNFVVDKPEELLRWA